MTDKQRIDLLLQIQEHPEQVTDEQLHRMMDDEQTRRLVEQLAFAKRAFWRERVPVDEPAIEAEWHRFATAYNEELNAIQQQQAPVSPSNQLRKIAAIFVGIAFFAGASIAALLLNKDTVKNDALRIEGGHSESIKTIKVDADTTKADTIAVEPRVFDNVSLEIILQEVATAHQVGVVYQDQKSRHLRFHFVWKREDCLDQVVEKLNNFESVNIEVEKNKLKVK